MSGRPVIEVAGIDVFYGSSQILFGVDLQVMEGQTLALLGRNGAGKSTTMKAIAGLAPPRKGAIRVLGREVTGRKPHVISRAGLGFVPEDRQIFPDHTVEDNLLIAQKKGIGDAEEWTLPRIYEVFPLLEPLRNRIAGRLSGGEQQMLAIARMLMGNPVALLLDEPSEGLAPMIVAEIFAVLRDLRESGAIVLLVEQNVHEALSLADRFYAVERGRIVLEGTAESPSDRERLIATISV